MADTKAKKPDPLDYSKKTARMDFEVKGEKQVIWVRQYWAYNHTTKNGATDWTSQEKKRLSQRDGESHHQGLERKVQAEGSMARLISPNTSMANLLLFISTLNPRPLARIGR